MSDLTCSKAERNNVSNPAPRKSARSGSTPARLLACPESFRRMDFMMGDSARPAITGMRTHNPMSRSSQRRVHVSDVRGHGYCFHRGVTEKRNDCVREHTAVLWLAIAHTSGVSLGRGIVAS